MSAAEEQSIFNKCTIIAIIKIPNKLKINIVIISIKLNNRSLSLYNLEN